MSTLMQAAFLFIAAGVGFAALGIAGQLRRIADELERIKALTQERLIEDREARESLAQQKQKVTPIGKGKR